MICCRVVHPLEILLELIFVHLNPHCLYNVSQFFVDRGNDCKYMKIIYVHCGDEMNITDPRSGDHY